jgi:peroxiredoxin Q/BCP
MAIQEGDHAPDLTLTTDSGGKLPLSSLRGKTVVLYFYPKADTPGCTTEACEFRDSAAQFATKDAVILGVSPDKPSAQSKFRTKYDLPFTLLCDPDHAAADAFGVWVEKSMYGKKYMRVERTTFVISPEGRIAKVFRKVKPAGHAAEVLSAVTSS